MLARKMTGLLLLWIGLLAEVGAAELKTWDGKHSVAQIDVSLVYFLPNDRTALPDWRERLEFYRSRIEQFHAREFGEQSVLKSTVLSEPFVSGRSTPQLRSGDANFIFFQTLREVDERLQFGRGERKGFPILLVMSDINWRPLDDFYRVKPGAERFEFEGQLIDGRHHPGAAAGGARATYLADRGVGWGLVSADGWRVPYCGSDCVVYHEGVGHPIGLPHPEPGNASVMSLAQYTGWISQSSVDEVQKKRLGWQASGEPFDRKKDLFSTFRALPSPSIPKPAEEVSLQLEWPAGADVKSGRVTLQTSLFGPWIEVATLSAGTPPASVRIGKFDRPAPVSYRVEVSLQNGKTAELRGYFQVREQPNLVPQPAKFSEDVETHGLQKPVVKEPVGTVEVDLLKLVNPQRDQVAGTWRLVEGQLESPKQYGARLQLPYEPPEEYRLTVIAEPLDPPNGLLLGLRSGEQQFVALTHYLPGKVGLNALENVDGKNVGNLTTIEADLLRQQRPSQIICTVRKKSVQVSVDGREIIDWQGDSNRLSLGDYWATPNKKALFLGAYDCRFRFLRVTLTPLKGTGKELR